MLVLRPAISPGAFPRFDHPLISFDPPRSPFFSSSFFVFFLTIYALPSLFSLRPLPKYCCVHSKPHSLAYRLCAIILLFSRLRCTNTWPAGCPVACALNSSDLRKRDDDDRSHPRRPRDVPPIVHFRTTACYYMYPALFEPVHNVEHGLPLRCGATISKPTLSEVPVEEQGPDSTSPTDIHHLPIGLAPAQFHYVRVQRARSSTEDNVEVQVTSSSRDSDSSILVLSCSLSCRRS